MTPELPSLDYIAQVARSADPKGVRLFLVTREVRPGIAKSARQLGKYIFRAHRIDLAPELQRSMVLGVASYLERYREHPIDEYKVVDDDQEKVVRYNPEGRDFPFMDVLRQQVLQGPDVPPVVDLRSIQDNVWAYCLGFGEDPTCYALKKLSSGRIAVDRLEDPRNGPLRKFRARFDTQTTKLEPMEGQLIYLDTSADAVFVAESFYALNKSAFEKVIGLEDEFVQTASDVLDELEQGDVIRGLESMREHIGSSIRLIKRLANIASDPTYRTVTPERREAMQEICKRLGYNLKINEDKIIVEDKGDLDLVLKLLEDYFLTSPQTGADYGAVAKRRL